MTASIGKVRYCVCNTTGTLHEYPVVADVDNDGHAEIIVSSNDYAWSGTRSSRDYATDECTDARVEAGDTESWAGVRAFAGPAHDWVGTRGIWNQHAYHVTNVTEDGRIPTAERRNWTVDGLNNFRANFQPGALNAPDLTLIEPGVDVTRCPSPLIFYVRVHNQGWAGAREGVPVTGYYRQAGGTTWTTIGTTHTTRRILPGEDEVVSFSTNAAGIDVSMTIEFKAVIGDGTSSAAIANAAPTTTKLPPQAAARFCSENASFGEQNKPGARNSPGFFFVTSPSRART